MVERVVFTAPVSRSDLRVVLANHTAAQHSNHAVAYRTQYGEVRVINWLTPAEAISRANALRNRGYKVVSGPMDV